MDRTTFAADPLPDPKTFSTFWAAEACALATGLGCVALAHLCEGNPCVIAFVSDKVAQHRPGHVERGFALPRRDLPLGRDIADKDRAACIDDGAGELVQGILAAVGDLGVQGLHLPLAAAPLRLSKPGFNIAIEARLDAVAERPVDMLLVFGTHSADGMSNSVALVKLVYGHS